MILTETYQVFRFKLSIEEYSILFKKSLKGSDGLKLEKCFDTYLDGIADPHLVFSCLFKDVDEAIEKINKLLKSKKKKDK